MSDRDPLESFRITPLPITLLLSWQRRFMNRAWPYAVQQADGSYRWCYEPCELDTLAAHLTGNVTLALSSTDTKGRTKWLCLDVDNRDTSVEHPALLAQLVELRATLAEQGWLGLVEASRRGGHLWFLLDRAIPALEARGVLEEALTQARAAGAVVPMYELYPDSMTPGTLGHAMRLPLGIHRLTGQRYPLLDSQGQYLTWSTLKAAVHCVLGQPRLSATLIRTHWQVMAMHAHRQVTEASSPASGLDDQVRLAGKIGTYSPVIRWVDTHVSLLDLLEDLAPETELRQVGRGYLGWCPFHDDRASDEAGRPGTPSFYVVQDRRFGWSWKCFSSNCAYSWGLMRHLFELFQRLLDLSVKQAILEACRRWPAADAYRAITGEEENYSQSNIHKRVEEKGAPTWQTNESRSERLGEISHTNWWHAH